MKHPISVVIITLNEAKNIVACITAAKQVSDDILVIDSGSMDGTVGLAQRAGARVIDHVWLGFAQTKNWGNQMAKHDWILSLDADEVLSGELIQTLHNIEFASDNVYSFNRFNNYCGHWIKHCNWYPDYVNRLFDRKYCAWAGEFVHEKLIYPTGYQLIKLSGELLHYTYRTAEEHYRKLEKYAFLSAQDRLQKGKKSSKWKIRVLPILKFLAVYFFHLGILDGTAGFNIAWREAWYVRRRNEWMIKLSDKVEERE